MSEPLQKNPHGATEHFLEGYERIDTPPPGQEHEVVIAIKKRNQDELTRIVERELYEPGHHRYQAWLSLEEMTQLTANIDGADAVEAYLRDNGIQPHWRCKSHGYFKANATIAAWESLLGNKFSLWGKPGESVRVLFAESYFLHPDVSRHVFHIFNVVDPPPYLHNKGQIRELASSGSTVTPSVLRKLYKQGTNSGHSSHSQSIFSTSDEYFSQSDLLQFQNKHGLKAQEAVSVGEHSLSVSSPAMCSTPSASTGYDCFEGNLDIQYIMGVAQDTKTIYHYVGDSNPFISYITAVSGDSDPPKVMSISWGSTEQAVSSAVMSAFCSEALALAARGVSILVSSGDNGAAGTGFSSTGVCNKDTCSTNSGSDGTCVCHIYIYIYIYMRSGVE